MKTIHNDELLLNARVQTRSQEKGIENNNNMNFVDRKSRNTSGKKKSGIYEEAQMAKKKATKKVAKKATKKVAKKATKKAAKKK